MPIANYSTSVGASKTVNEIQGILVAHGAKSIHMDYKDGVIIGLEFDVETPYGKMPIRLPVKPHEVQKVMEHDGLPPRYCTYQQAVKVAWRIAKDWIRAQMAYLETDMVRMEEVFLPYAVMKNGRTVYQVLADNRFYLKEGEEE